MKPPVVVTSGPTKWLTSEDVARIDAGHCPDCGWRGFVLGPRGGSSINIECGNIKFCGHRFNIAQFPTSHRIVMAHRIDSRKDGGSDWNL